MTATDVLSDAATPLIAEAQQIAKTAHLRDAESEQDEAAPEPKEHNLVRAMQHVQQPWLAVEAVPTLRLGAVRLSGLRDMRPGFLRTLFHPYVDASVPDTFWARLWYGDRLDYAVPGQPTTFTSLLEGAASLSRDLSRLELVKGIDVALEPSKVSTAHPGEDVDIVLRAKQSGRFFLKTNTSVGQSEGTASIQGKIRNMFGGAESLEGSATLGTRTRHAYNLLFATPVLANPDLWANVSVLSQHRDLTSYLSANEGKHMARTALMWIPFPGMRHEIAYEASQRHFHHFLPSASVAVRRLAKPTLKSSITYMAEHDTRDDPFMTTTGSYFKTLLEYAGLGGDTSFLKGECEYGISRTFGQGWAWSYGMRGGCMHSLDEKPVCLSDRFMLGGPTDVRMFRLNSLGPKQKCTCGAKLTLDDALGGTAFWAMGLGLAAPPPFLQDWPLKLHAFANMGQLAQTPRNKPLSFSELWQPSASAGVGLFFQQGPIRLELNFGLPIVARHLDGTRKGFQFGIGLDFL